MSSVYARADGFEKDAVRWLQEVTRYARALTRDEADAADLIQETFFRAYKSWHTFTPGTDCRRWLFAICRNLFVDARRRDQRQVTCDGEELEALAAEGVGVWGLEETGEAGDSLPSPDLADAVQHALAQLPQPFREVVVLVDLRDQSYDTAAEALSVPLGTVRSRLYRGRRLLEGALVTHARDAGLVPFETVTSAGAG